MKSVVRRDQSIVYIPLTTSKEFSEQNGRGLFGSTTEISFNSMCSVVLINCHSIFIAFVGTISFRGRSNSLDSISTALSFGTVSQACVPSRCSSLDNLLPGPQSHDSSMQRHTRSHDKQYSLLDNESVSSVGENSEVERQGEIPQTEREIPQRTELTLSLPTSLDQTVSLSCSGTPARAKQRQSILKRREVDEFSDNFVTAEPEDVSPRSMSMSEKKIHVSVCVCVCVCVCVRACVCACTYHSYLTDSVLCVHLPNRHLLA